MIFALEGPDRCGKTSLFEELKSCLPNCVFVPRLPVDKSLLPVMRSVEARNDALWRALYDERKLYICDRHLSVSNQVYSLLYDREPLDVSFWYGRVHPVYLRVPANELARRHAVARDDLFDVKCYEYVCSLYESVLTKFHSRTELNGTLSTKELAGCLSKSLSCISDGG